MRKIDKTAVKSTKYKAWVDKLVAEGNEINPAYRYYYDDVAMNLYKCQKGVCAYTEMYICVSELYKDENWKNGKFKLSDDEINRNDHFGELEHYDAENKKVNYWNWDNLFMIHAKINSIKTNRKAATYLKPDLSDYRPETYFDYDHETHRYIPNTDIEDVDRINEIRDMIDNVLLLNHGAVKNERSNYINLLKHKQEKGDPLPAIDRFFTSVKWVLEIYQDDEAK